MFWTPGLLLWGAAAVPLVLVLFLFLVLVRHNLHSSDLRVAFTSSPLIFPRPRIAFTDPCVAFADPFVSFTDPCVAFTDPCVSFTDPLHSACSSFAALTHLTGSVELFEAFISFFPRCQLGSPGAEPGAILGAHQELTRSKPGAEPGAKNLQDGVQLQRVANVFPPALSYLPVLNCSSNNLASFSSLLYLLSE